MKQETKERFMNSICLLLDDNEKEVAINILELLKSTDCSVERGIHILSEIEKMLPIIVTLSNM